MTFCTIALLLAAQSGGPSEAEAAYKALCSRLAKITSFRLDESLARNGKVFQTATFEIQRPNFSRVETKFPLENSWMTNVGDGQSEWMNCDDGYIKNPAAANTVKSVPNGFEQFAGTEAIEFNFLDCSQTTFNGAPATKIRMTFKQMPKLEVDICVDNKTGLPAGFIVPARDPKAFPAIGTYSNLVVDQPIDKSRFVMNLPADAKPYHVDASSNLIQVGQPVPKFATALVGGEKCDLSTALAGKKALIVNFWFCGCPPCQKELPELQATYERLKSKGLGLVTVNTQDSNADILSFEKQRKLNLPVIGDADSKAHLSDKFGIAACPTNYIIGPDGKVAATFVGYDKEGIAKALKALGVE